MRILFHKGKLLVGQSAYRSGQRVIVVPKIRICTVDHGRLERIRLASFIVRNGTSKASVDQSRIEISLQLSVDELRRVVFLKPQSQPFSLLWSDSVNRAFNLFDSAVHLTVCSTREGICSTVQNAGNAASLPTPTLLRHNHHAIDVAFDRSHDAGLRRNQFRESCPEGPL